MFGAFTSFGKLGALASSVARAWSPAALWPTGTEPGMWIDPSNLASQWQDSTGTTPVATPGTVADASNPVGLARDLRSGNPPPLGPELVVDGDFSDGASWNKQGNWTVSGGSAHSGNPSSGLIYSFPTIPFIEGALYAVTVESSGGQAWVSAGGRYHILTFPPGTNTKYVTGWAGSPYTWVGIEAENDVSVANISVREVPGNHLLQATSTARPLLSAYDGQTLGPGDTYPSTGFPVYQKYDGTDDGMATATFAAGTLSNAMDCLIAVRRDSATQAVCGLYESVSDANKVFCIAESGSGSGCVGSGAGTPTVWVDGAQLTGGTAVTRGTLHTALSAGDWHILELRGLDLSTWTAAGAGMYTSYVLNGAQGGILLFPSSTSTADRDAARTWLGAKVGLTL